MRLFLISALLTFCFISHAQPNKHGAYTQVQYDSIKLVLEKMYDADQNIRRILIDSIGFDSPNAGQYIKRMQEIDKENKQNIVKILTKYGWIEKSKIGSKASEAIFYTIQHSDLALMDKYLPDLKRLAEMGEAKPIHAAMMEDRVLMNKGKKQIYGTQANDWFRADRKMAIWPIEDPAHVNERRKKVGFAKTVEEYAKNLPAEYNPADELPTKEK
jgi:hypothetical protein